MSAARLITNKCNHCGGEFQWKYVTSLCPKCFVAGHRFDDCGDHCKETIQSRGIAETVSRKRE